MQTYAVCVCAHKMVFCINLHTHTQRDTHMRAPTPHHLLRNRYIFLMDSVGRGRAEIVSIDFIFGRLRSGHLVLQYTLLCLPRSHHPSASHWRRACPAPLYMPPSSPSTSPDRLSLTRCPLLSCDLSPIYSHLPFFPRPSSPPLLLPPLRCICLILPNVFYHVFSHSLKSTTLFFPPSFLASFFYRLLTCFILHPSSCPPSLPAISCCRFFFSIAFPRRPSRPLPSSPFLYNISVSPPPSLLLLIPRSLIFVSFNSPAALQSRSATL